MIDGFLQAVRSMKNKDAELVEFLDKFDGVCLEAKSDNVQEWSLRLLGAAEFPGSFEKFVSFAMRLADRLEAERAAGPAPAPAPEAPHEAPHGLGGFIQV